MLCSQPKFKSYVNVLVFIYIHQNTYSIAEFLHFGGITLNCGNYNDLSEIVSNWKELRQKQNELFSTDLPLGKCSQARFVFFKSLMRYN